MGGGVYRGLGFGASGLEVSGPEHGPLPPLKGSDVWALTVYGVCKGYIRGTLLRAHTRGPSNYP